MKRKIRQRTAAAILKAKLRPGETILWKAHPAVRLWSYTIVKSMLMSCFLLGYSAAVMTGIWIAVQENPQTVRIKLVILFYFFIACASMFRAVNLLASRQQERDNKRRSLHVLTNRRLITITWTFKHQQQVRTFSTHKLSHVRTKLRRNGTGRLILGYGRGRKKRYVIRDVTRLREVAAMLQRRIGNTPVTPA